MYRPNFCAECGERITRTRWRLTTSRRFCPKCDLRFRRARIFVPLAICGALFSIGLVMGRATHTKPPPLIVERGELPSAPAITKAGTVSNAAKGEDESRTDSSSDNTNPEPRYGPDGTQTERPTDPNEVVSICGARTQKGTPCQRRVRGTGRCWQHRGMPAMLPPAKLIVQG